MQHNAVEQPARLWRVIFASSAGTLIEWYDFYIFGSLATILASQFFPKDNPTAGLLFTLATLATGFLVRPFGALFFGRMGDIVGRKTTFLTTLLVMGVSTTAIGVVPTYERIGVVAPLIVLLLRLFQGLAIGGEYGGAATYVAEHSPAGRRGYFTSFIQTTATLGLFVSLLVILATRTAVGEAAFSDQGWRIPFLLSSVLVVFSYFVRRKMDESPEFARIKAEGKTSSNPLRDSFMDPANRRLVLIALFGAMCGQAVVWYTAQFYALYFIQTVLNIQGAAATKILALALVAGTPFYIVFGSLSDRIGRKKLIVSACLIATIAFYPLYAAMLKSGTLVPSGAPVVKIESSLDLSTKLQKSVRIEQVQGVDGSVQTTKTKIGSKDKPKVEVEPSSSMFWTLTILVFLQVMMATLAYAPIAAFLVEMFPTRIRYTSLSLPYHIGNGVFGGLVPLIGTGLVTWTGNKLAGVFYPIAIALLCFIVGSIFIHEKRSGDGFEDVV